MNTDISVQSKRFLALLLVFRWLALSPILWLFFTPEHPAVPSRQTLWVTVIAIGSTVAYTLFQRKFFRWLAQFPWLVVADMLAVIVILTLTGAAASPFLLFALTPLLAGAVLLPTKQMLALGGAFTASYLLAVLIANEFSGLTVNLGILYAQIMAAWLTPWVLHVPFSQFLHAQAKREKAEKRFQELLGDNRALTAEYSHLEIIHELTSILQGASNAQEVQKRLLDTITAELGFSRAVMALMNHDVHRLEEWRSAPGTERNTLFSAPLVVEEENGLLAQIMLDGQAQWIAPQHKLTSNRHLNEWLGNEHWLVLPIAYQTKNVALVMVTGDATRKFDFSDRIWATLAAITSQAGEALGTLAYIQNLAREKERNRIARDIHDSVAQSLFGIVFTLDACVKLLPNHAEDVREELLTLRGVAEQVRQEVRESIIEQWSSTMTAQKFRTGLRKYIAGIATGNVFHIEFNIDGDFDGLPTHIQQTLYRVSQEALANAVHHANVDAARLYLYVEADEVFLSIRDKGKGFVPASVLTDSGKDHHFGLHGIQERVQAIGGLCDVLSQPQQGTQILVRIPRRGEKHDNGK